MLALIINGIRIINRLLHSLYVERERQEGRYLFLRLDRVIRKIGLRRC